MVRREDVSGPEVEQRRIADEVIAEITAAKLWPARIVTELAGAAPFYVAEDYHQEYFAQNARQPYCQVVVAPKVAKFRKHFGERLKQRVS